MNEMKTAAQHNAELTGIAEVPAQPVRRESREALEIRAAKLTDENKALKSLIQDVSEGAALTASQQQQFSHSPRESMINTGALLMPGGTRIVLHHIQKYAPGGDYGICFSLSDGGHIWNPPSTPSEWERLGWEPSRGGCRPTKEKLQVEALAAIDKLFNVQT